ncbi:hypothetical protein Leryth_012534 [Lithospermum erythrorhizon]|nr:hypothetical protein Leryth_012534 [Lithospermum erythrorhizon]
MTRPKQLPNELLSDLAVSSATKLQCFRHLGKYFKQSAKALDKQVAREARFYGALIRLQKNWKVKRHRMVASASGNEGFYIDLFDNSLYDPAVALRPSSVSTIRIEHDSAGMLAVNLPPNSYRSLKFELLGSRSTRKGRNREIKEERSTMDSSMEYDKEHINDVEYIRETHSVLRRVHQAIFDEQVFDLVYRGPFNPSPDVHVTGIQENYLRLSIGEVASLSISLVPSGKDDAVASTDIDDLDAAHLSLESSNVSNSEGQNVGKIVGFPSPHCFEIYLQQIFHEHVFVKAKGRSGSIVKAQASGPPVKENLNLLGHFCMSLAHRIFSNKVLGVLDDLVARTPYVQLTSHPTWHSRTSCWSLAMKVPQSILNHGGQHPSPGIHHVTDAKSLFQTMVVVNDDCISVEGEGAPNIVGLFKGKTESMNPMNRYDCDVADLPVILLQQVASHIIRWLHEEALVVGIKTNRDFLSLSFEMDQGESVALTAHVDPDDPKGCISWWLVIYDRLRDDHGSQANISAYESHTRKFLGFLPLEVLYSTLLDLISLCSTYGIH